MRRKRKNQQIIQKKNHIQSKQETTGKKEGQINTLHFCIGKEKNKHSFINKCQSFLNMNLQILLVGVNKKIAVILDSFLHIIHKRKLS